MNLLLLLLLSGVQIERVDLPLNGLHRPGEWTLADVTVAGDASFDGTLEVFSEGGLSSGCSIHLTAGSKITRRIPFVASGAGAPSVVLRHRDGSEAHRAPFPDSWRPLNDSDLLVAFVGPSPVVPAQYALEGRMAFVTEFAGPLPERSWYWEPVDIMIGSVDPGTAWKMMGGEGWPDGENLQERLGGFKSRRNSRIRLVDDRPWALHRSTDPWPTEVRSFATYFLLVYALVVFLISLVLSGRRWILAGSLGLAVISFGAAAVVWTPPAGISVRMQRFEYRHSDGTGAAARFEFFSHATGGTLDFAFSRPVRPIYRDPREGVLTGCRLDFGVEGSCTIRGWNASPGSTLAVMSCEETTPPKISIEPGAGGPPYTITLESQEPLHDAAVLVNRWNGSVGNVAPGESRTFAVQEDGTPPRDVEFVFARQPYVLGGDFLFARLDPIDERTAHIDSRPPSTVRAHRYLLARFPR